MNALPRSFRFSRTRGRRPRRRPGRLAVNLAVLAVSLACAEGPSAARDDLSTLVLRVVSGDEQKSRVATRLPVPVSVRVVDAHDAPAPGRTVAFVVTAGGGQVSAPSVTTDADGLAQVWWTLGPTAGPNSLDASLKHPVSGQSVRTVTFRAQADPDGPSALLAGECDRARTEWIWCDDFEADRAARYFEYDAASGAFVRAAAVGMDGSFGMRARFAAGQVSAGSLKVAFGRTPAPYFRPVDAGTARFPEIYWRMYVRREPGWTGGGGYKLSRATSLVASTWAQAMIAHVWSGNPPNENFLVLDPASGTDEQGNVRTREYNDFVNLRWLGARRGSTALFDAARAGQWQCVEARVRLNDAGQSNGLFQLWINGALDAEATGLNWVGSFATYGVNAVFFENYWNGGAPRAQERYFDNLVVSTQRIGCVEASSAPPAPVAAVTIEPGAPTVRVGETLQLSATARDAAGNALAGRPVSWSSSNTAVATVSASGVVTGVAVGTATITASSEGKSGSASLRVTAAPTAGASNEPAGMTRITDRPFNTKATTDSDRGGANCIGGSECWDGVEFRDPWTIFQDPTAPAPGGRVAQQKYPAGFGGGSSPQGVAQIAWPQTAGYRTIYHRFWLKLSTNFFGHQTGTNKVFHLWAPPGNITYYSTQGTGNGPLQFQVRLQGIPDPVRMFPPNVAGQTGAQVIRGRWQLFEVLLTLNTPGQRNGSFRVWQDGVLTHDYSGREMLGAGVANPFWWQVQWSPTWGGGGGVVPQDMYQWLDQVYVSGGK